MCDCKTDKPCEMHVPLQCTCSISTVGSCVLHDEMVHNFKRAEKLDDKFIEVVDEHNKSIVTDEDIKKGSYFTHNSYTNPICY